MIKVMDPNVHQMTVQGGKHGSVKGGNVDSDDDDEQYEHRSDLTGVRTVIIKGGMQPKIDMKKKIARQSDLITSLERSEIRKNDEVYTLKQKVKQQEELIAEMQRLKEIEEEKTTPFPVIEDVPEVIVEEVEVVEEVEDEFEASGELQIFDEPGIVNGAKSDRSVSELGDGQPFDKWHANDSQAYYKGLLPDRK